jgi:hypothetical protein
LRDDTQSRADGNMIEVTASMPSGCQINRLPGPVRSGFYDGSRSRLRAAQASVRLALNLFVDAKEEAERQEDTEKRTACLGW